MVLGENLFFLVKTRRRACEKDYVALFNTLGLRLPFAVLGSMKLLRYRDKEEMRPQLTWRRPLLVLVVSEGPIKPKDHNEGRVFLAWLRCAASTALIQVPASL